MTTAAPPLLETRNVSVEFGSVIALRDISITLRAGEVLCLLGDNGAGKSTLIKVLSGVYAPKSGSILIDGRPQRFGSPRDAQTAGIATVYQDLAMIPMMSITRNFFLGREPVSSRSGWLRHLRLEDADRIAREQMMRIGIDIRDPRQAVGTLSGGERQTLAIARAVYFGARALILDEPTSALGVAQTSMVLRYVTQVRERGLGVVFITHNARHAMAVADSFTVLNRGRSVATFRRGKIGLDDLQTLMAGDRDIVPDQEEQDAGWQATADR